VHYKNSKFLFTKVAEGSMLSLKTPVKVAELEYKEDKSLIQIGASLFFSSNRLTPPGMSSARSSFLA
jgi:hypothetical protein